MAWPCAPTIPAPAGTNQTQPVSQLAAPPLPVPIQVGNIVLAPPPGEFPPAQQVPAVVSPRNIDEIPLGNAWVLAWLATLCRATYSPTADLFNRAAAIVGGQGLSGLTPNAAGSSVPGYGTIAYPNFLIVVISGTTNASQWLSQTLRSQMVDWAKPMPFIGTAGAVGTQAIWRDAAIAIAQTLAIAPTSPPILFVGHSMGGAIAHLMAGVFSARANTNITTRVVSFASPKAGDNRLTQFSRTGAQVYRRLWLSGDVVPTLPPNLGVGQVIVPEALQALTASWARFQHAGQGYSFLPGLGPVSTADQYAIVAWAQAMQAAAAGNPLALAQNHAMRSYTDALLYYIANGGSTPPTNWTNAADLVGTNAALTAAGL